MRKVYGSYLSGIMGAVALVLVGMTRTASATVIFTSIPAPLPGNVASEGPEAYSFKELGDGIAFPSGTGGTLTTVKVIMSSWGCTSGHWNIAPPAPGSCVTKPGAKFSQPITMNIYTVANTVSGKPQAGTLLGTQTATFQIRYRPSTDAVRCKVGGNPGSSDGGAWYSS